MLNSIHIGQSGLATANTAIENSSNNLANQNTIGYHDRVVEIEEVGQVRDDGIGGGSITDDIVRITNEYLSIALMEQETQEAYYDELSTLFGDLEVFFKETDTSGLSVSIDEYFKAIVDLNSDSTDIVNINNYIDKANTLVSELQSIYAKIEDKEDVLLESVELDAQRVQEILDEIGEINEDIANKGATNDLLDRRDLLERELATYMDIEIDNNHPYEITVGGERILWENNVRDVAIKEELTAQKDRYVVDTPSGMVSSLDTGTPMNADDKFVYTINNVGSVEITFGQPVLDSQGNALDINGDGVVDATDVVDNTNYVRALSVAINADPYMNKLVTAYNGDYAVDTDGNILPNDMTIEKYLVIEAKTPGTDGKFDSSLEFVRQDATIGVEENIEFEVNEERSKEAENEVFLVSYDADTVINISNGSIQAKLENLNTNSSNNIIQQYKDALDSFAFTLADIHTTYAVSSSDGSYIYGDQSFIGEGTNLENQIPLNLFSGSSVKTLEFHEDAVYNLTQQDLDYMLTFQYKNDFSFNNGAQDPDGMYSMSLMDYFQNLLVDVSTNKENNDFLLDTQSIVVQSTTMTYDQLTKVNVDEEMLDLIKFQAAYDASAKVISTSDQMLQTLLGM